MKVKVTDGFRDKYTYQFHKIDAVIEVTPERYAEIKDRVVVIEEPKDTKPKSKK